MKNKEQSLDRKTYTSPSLKRYGKVSDITAANGQGNPHYWGKGSGAQDGNGMTSGGPDPS